MCMERVAIEGSGGFTTADLKREVTANGVTGKKARIVQSCNGLGALVIVGNADGELFALQWLSEHPHPSLKGRSWDPDGRHHGHAWQRRAV